MRRIVLASVLTWVSAGAAVAQDAAPAGKCKLNFESDRVSSIQLPSKQYNSFLAGGVIARCPNQKMILKADSLEVYGDEGRFFFVGHVDYKEPRLALKSDYLTYFQREERLLAVLNVDAKLPSGSTLKGNSLEFFRSIPKVRPKQRAVAIGRPTITIIEKDAQGKPQPPATITGNTVWMEADSIVASSGDVVVVRPELTAVGDSLFLDNGTGILRLMRKPKITGTKGRSFTLLGGTVDLLSRRRKLERVLAKDSAVATSEDLNLRSDTIDMRVTDDLLQRATAWGKSRARATSPQQTIVSDSIDVIMPGQRVREMHAVRNAVAEGTPDTTKFSTTEKDRLMGDTIIALFDSIPKSDTVSKPRIRTLIAIGHASSLQHLAPQDTTLRKPAFNYVCGQRIIVTFDSAKVKNVKVDDSNPPCGGIYIEPEADASKKTKPPATTPPGSPPAVTNPPGSAPVPTPKPVTPAPATPVKKP
jgi:hypothetical protein